MSESMGPEGVARPGALLVPFHGVRPRVSPQAWLAPTAALIGDVTVEADASVFYGAVVRGDMAPVTIGVSVRICRTTSSSTPTTASRR